MLSRNRSHVGILGAGAWGTAIGKILAEKGNKVEIWCYEQDVARSINKDNTNSRYLIGVTLPSALKATTDISEAADKKNFLFVAVPSLFLLDVVKEIIQTPGIVKGHTPIGVLSKGFVETNEGIKLIADALEDYLPGSYRNNLVYISGPSHAEEVARGKITGLISASKNGANSIRFRKLLADEHLLVFSSLDITGVQISAALKNVIAIAFGIMDALSEFSERFGDNTESLLLAAGLNEIQQLGLAMGATHPETFTSIAAVGDLDVTCRSKFGRNRRFGREIILDHLIESYRDIDAVISAMPAIGYLAEGVVTARYTQRLAKKYKLSLPICDGVFRILNREADPLKEVDRILKYLSGTPNE